MISTTEKAPAKLNLSLDVTEKRPDGYHLLRTVMQTVSLYDELSFVREEQEGIRLTCDRADLPLDSGNLAYRAADVLLQKFNLPSGIRIDLKKKIPAAAGLAGGSTDAAAVLRAMNRLYGLGLTTETLCQLALPLGADIPYCVRGGTCLCEGIGEGMTPLAELKGLPVLLVKPAFDLSTAYIYRELSLPSVPQEAHPKTEEILAGLDAIRRKTCSAAQASNTGALSTDTSARPTDTSALVAHTGARPTDTSALVAHTGARPTSTSALATDLGALLTATGGNLLELPALKAHPELQDLKQALRNGGAVYSAMTGSGSCVFGIFETAEAAEACRRNLPALYSGEIESAFTAETLGTTENT